MVKDNPIHKQQIDPVLMADRFPYYDLDGRLVADAHEIAELAAGHEEPIGRAYWTAFNALPHVRKAEGELLEAYVRGSTRHMLVKYSDPAGQESATTACPHPHMAPRVGWPLASRISCLRGRQRPHITQPVA